MTEQKLKGVCIGAGYFSHYQYEAWQRIPEVRISAFSNRDQLRARSIMERFGFQKCYADYREMFDAEKPDFVDVITPPPSHREICAEAAGRGIHVICQKPLAPSLEEARRIVNDAAAARTRFMVHENFRFQPWHREIKRLIDEGAVGKEVFSLSARSRMGDGWGENAYIPRQPYFREYPRLLIYETGVHFIDTYRYLLGEVRRATAWLRRLNPLIKGEDCGLMVLEFASGALGTWDANRYNETTAANPRYTFGEFMLEGEGGTIRVYPDSRLTVQALGKPETEVAYTREDKNFAGDCCYFTQRHFVDRLLDGREFETSGQNYLKTLAVQEAVYRSAAEGRPVDVSY